MKILLCTNAFENVTNGPAKFAHLMTGIQNFNGNYEVRILTEDITDPQENIYKLNLKIPRWLKPAGMFLRMFQYHKRAMDIRKIDYPFDVLLYNNAIVGLWSALRFRNVIGFINDDNNLTASWKDFWKFKWSRKQLFYLTEWLACKWVKKIIVNSDYLKSRVKHEYRCSETKLFRLYKAIELKPEIVQKRNETPVILFVKNDFERGGLEILAKALNQSDRKIKLIIVGTPGFALSKIKSYFSNPLVDYEIKGFLPQDEVYSLMHKADIFCVPSLREGFGVANLEAMCFDCAVISTRTGGIPEATANGDCAWLVEPGNFLELGNAIRDCLTNESLCNQKKEAARNYVKNFSVEKMYSNIIEIVNN